MREITSWVSLEVMRLVGLALLHFLWQGLALAALASAAMSAFRSAASRYAIGVGALAIMVAAPPITYLALQHATQGALSAKEFVAAPTAPVDTVSPAHANNAPFRPSPDTPTDSLTWLVEGWFAGVLLCSLRTVCGFLWIERLRRKECGAVAGKLLSTCLALQQRLGLRRVIRYCECVYLQAPAVIGWFRPVVLLPVTALTGLSEAQLETVIAHELAHIKRLDGFINLFQIAAETVLFYHPAVWWLSQRIRAERENCCDDAALAVCGNPIEYARALALMAEWRAAPSLAMAANRSPLAERVARMLGMKQREGGRNHAGLAASVLCLSAALFAGNAFVGIARVAHAAQALAPQVQAESPRDPEAPIIVRASQVPSAKPTHATPPTPPVGAEQERPDTTAKSSYIDGLKAEGVDNLSVDELVSLEIQGITPEYVHAIHELGLRPSADELIGLRVQGVTPTYIQDLRGVGFNPDIDEVIGMKVQGVTPEYVKSLQELKLKTSADDVIGMRVQGVTPEYVKGLRDLGLQVDTDEVIGMKVQGVTPEYIKELRALGLKLDGDEIVGMKVQGVTPDYVRTLQGLGLHLDSDDVIGMKVQGVTPEYVKSLREAGLQLDTEELIGAKVQGITPEFIAEAKSHGFQNLDLDKLIALKHSGVFDK
jgi:beta-lactamase regulating signal transducer with metallopeptidase domain